jgi:hypothetical protein
MGDITLGVATSKAQIDGGTISGVTSLTTPTSSVIGLYGAPAVAVQATAAAGTDAATTQTLANALRTALLNMGVIA